MRSVIALLLVIVAIAAYFVLAAAFGIFQLVPWPHLLLAFGACVVLAVEARRRGERSPRQQAGRVAALVLGVLLTAAYTWYIVDYSSYRDAPPASIAAGDRFPDLASLTLTDADGEPTPLLASGAASRATLIVFYRGFW